MNVINRVFNKNKNKGFTLVELIAVIMILGILILIATPNFLDNTRTVSGKEILNNVRFVDYNLQMYEIKNEANAIESLNLLELDRNYIQAAYEKQRIFNKNGYAHIASLEDFYDLSNTEITQSIKSNTVGIYVVKSNNVYFIADKSVNVAMDFSEDTDPPIITIGSYPTHPTNGDVTVCATTNEGYLNQDCYTFTENGSFEFIATDLAGNETTETVTMDLIDKTPPIITIGAYNTSPTNQDILVTATLDDGTFTSANSHTFTENGSFTFTATDAVGNTSSETVTITNIDKIPPTTPTFNVNVDGGTGTVTITYSADSEIKQYRVDSGAWTNYTAPVVLTNNATVYAKGTDAAGNESSISEVDVTVDTDPPVVTFATNGNTTPMKTQSTAVNVVDEGSGVDEGSLEYVWSTSSVAPGAGWASFSNGATLSQSTGTGTYYLHIKAADTIGNAGVYSSSGFNVDNTPPVITVDSYNSAWTNQNITVTASTDKGTLNATSHTFTGNESFLFRAEDAAGNVTNRNVTISNIDKIAPTISAFGGNSTPKATHTMAVPSIADTGGSEIATSQYAWSTSTAIPTTGWINISGSSISGTFTSNRYLHVRATDNAGNITTTRSITAFVFAEMYNYSIYNVTTTYYTSAPWGFEGQSSRPGPRYTSFTFNAATRTFSGSGTELGTDTNYGYWQTAYMGSGKIAYISYMVRSYDADYGRNMWGGSGTLYTALATPTQSRGSLRGTTTGTVSAYPISGIHTDGYWYVRGSKIN